MVTETQRDYEGQHDGQSLCEEKDASSEKGSRDVDHSFNGLCHGNDDKEESEQAIEKQQVEILVVEEANTIVHPWAVMVHL